MNLFGEETRTVHEIVQKTLASFGFYGFDVEFDADWTGAPSVFVWIRINPNHPTSAAAIEALTAVHMKVSRALLEANLGKFPYVGFREDRSVASTQGSLYAPLTDVERHHV